MTCTGAGAATATEARTVLLTGASGVIGRAVADELSEDFHVIGLAHVDKVVPEVGELLIGDLERPWLGLPEKDWQELADRVDVVIHSGALTQWGQSWEKYQAINVGGTARVIDFARHAGAPVHYVSTCFVHAIERHALDVLGPDNVVTRYIQSKAGAERLLAESGVPRVVYRPTNLIGHSRSGASSRPQIVQLISDWICRGKAPYIPAHPGNLVDVVPLDVTARAIAGVVRAGDVGGTHWITYGPTAMTMEEAQDILVTHARDAGRAIDTVPIVDPTGPLPVPLDAVPAISRAFLKVLVDVSEVIHACGGVLPTSMPDLCIGYGVPDVSHRDAYLRSLTYWTEQRYWQNPIGTAS